jgi:hypothetical protein
LGQGIKSKKRPGDGDAASDHIKLERNEKAHMGIRDRQLHERSLHLPPLLQAKRLIRLHPNQ